MHAIIIRALHLVAVIILAEVIYGALKLGWKVTKFLVKAVWSYVRRPRVEDSVSEVLERHAATVEKVRAAQTAEA